jgi:hypothetical protein
MLLGPLATTLGDTKMDASVMALCFGLWFGLTGPLVIHVPLSLLIRHERLAVPSKQDMIFTRFIRFLAMPLAMLGLLGVASVFGSMRMNANFTALGMLLGLAAYGFFFFLYRTVSNGVSPNLLSERELWLNRWEMNRAAGQQNFLWQSVFLGSLLGLFASLIVASINPRIAETNIGEAPWSLLVFAFFPVVSVLYAWWTWYISERMYRALQVQNDT